MLKWVPISKDLLSVRQDPQDPRLSEFFLPRTEQKAPSICPFALAGYPDDEGISLNGGRPGASEAPNVIRRMLSKMTPPHLDVPSPLIEDWGNLSTEIPLKQRHEEVFKAATQSYNENRKWIGLGGGHDYGYPDCAAFVECFKSESTKPLVINIDAHLDVRPLTQGLSSGTPFFRLLESHSGFDFLEIGIQSQCNSLHHLNWLKSKGGRYLNWETIEDSSQSLSQLVKQTLGDWLQVNRPCFLSVDIDAFSSSYAMGCSQSWPTGLEPGQFFPLLGRLSDIFDIKGLGIYEVSPPLDLDHRTSKLAALILHRFLFHAKP